LDHHRVQQPVLAFDLPFDARSGGVFERVLLGYRHTNINGDRYTNSDGNTNGDIDLYTNSYRYAYVNSDIAQSWHIFSECRTGLHPQ
jgi:hypothetical protein